MLLTSNKANAAFDALWLVSRCREEGILYALVKNICVVFTNFHHTKLYSFQNRRFILQIFSKFCEFQPRNSYKTHDYHDLAHFWQKARNSPTQHIETFLCTIWFNIWPFCFRNIFNYAEDLGSENLQVGTVYWRSVTSVEFATIYVVPCVKSRSFSQNVLSFFINLSNLEFKMTLSWTAANGKMRQTDHAILSPMLRCLSDKMLF